MIRIRKTTLPPAAILMAIAAALLLVLAACGGDDDDDGPGGSASPAASGDEPSATEEGSPVETPAGTGGIPAECSEGDAQRGLLSELSFGADGVFDSGEEVEMTMTLINCGDNDVSLTFPTAQRYIVSITSDPSGVEVWNSADGKSFNQVESTEDIPPGETVVYTETWDQADSGGEQVPDGRYKVSFLSTGCGVPESTECRFGPIKFIQIGEVQETDAPDETETPEAS